MRGGSALACASIDGSYSLLRQMAHVSAQAERSGCARSATRMRWQNVSTGAGVEYECVVRTSANVPRPESHRVPDGKVRHTRVRQAAVAMCALRLWHAASSTAPSHDGLERDQQAWTHHFFTTNRCLESPPVSFSTSMSSSSAIKKTRGRGAVAPIEALGARKRPERVKGFTPSIGTFTHAFTSW